ncbi:hypothetical protein UPYG_G00072780 [Umbra pygmaea]|uniref:MD-2-related lipid-recognition domain-containing protein n=1 Tax=Umbra pygmaea TaxID=75934 RepID=A0ABD0XTS1_UMBPY
MGGIMPHHSLLLFLAILVHWPWRGLVQEVKWPRHTVCSMDKLQIFYQSCDPLQDIGLSVSPCPETLRTTRIETKLKVTLLLWQSIEDLYMSVNLFPEGGGTFHFDESLCLPDYPRFTFCNRKKGELIAVDTQLKLNILKYLPNHINAHAVLVNQNGYRIACFNMTLMTA